MRGEGPRKAKRLPSSSIPEVSIEIDVVEFVITRSSYVVFLHENVFILSSDQTLLVLNFVH